MAYCTDLGFGAARGAEMLSLMRACGMFSRLVSGVICDRIGGVRTLLLGSALQGVGLMLFLPIDGMVSLYPKRWVLQTCCIKGPYGMPPSQTPTRPAGVAPTGPGRRSVRAPAPGFCG